MKSLDFDKNDILAFTDDDHFTNAKLEILTRIRQNLLEKVAEIDDKISTIKNSS